MDNRQNRTLKRLRSVLGFLKQHPIDPEPPLLRRMRTQLERSMERIAALSATQYVASRAPRSHAARVRQMRVRLRRDRMVWRSTHRVHRKLGRPKQRHRRGVTPGTPETSEYSHITT